MSYGNPTPPPRRSNGMIVLIMIVVGVYLLLSRNQNVNTNQEPSRRPTQNQSDDDIVGSSPQSQPKGWNDPIGGGGDFDDQAGSQATKRSSDWEIEDLPNAATKNGSAPQPKSNATTNGDWEMENVSPPKSGGQIQLSGPADSSPRQKNVAGGDWEIESVDSGATKANSDASSGGDWKIESK